MRATNIFCKATKRVPLFATLTILSKMRAIACHTNILLQFETTRYEGHAQSGLNNIMVGDDNEICTVCIYITNNYNLRTKNCRLVLQQFRILIGSLCVIFTFCFYTFLLSATTLGNHSKITSLV